MTITINHFLIVSFLLFAIGFFGVLVRRNFLTVLMSVELMLNAVNINLIAFSRRLSDLTGQIFSIFVITIVMGDFVTIGVMGGQQIASAGKIIEARLNALQFPAAAANAVILLGITILIISSLTRIVDIRKEL